MSILAITILSILIFIFLVILAMAIEDSYGRDLDMQSEDGSWKPHEVYRNIFETVPPEMRIWFKVFISTLGAFIMSSIYIIAMMLSWKWFRIFKPLFFKGSK